MKRWIRRIFLILLVLLLAYAAVVLVILHTDFPRNLVLKTLNEKYGLNVTVDSMQITYGGQTIIDNLSLSLPMEDAPILAVPQIIIKHTKIPFVLFQGFKLKQVKIENPIVNISQDQTGTWNLQRLTYNFQQASNGDKRKSLSIPDLEILYGTAIITNRNGDTETIGPIVLEGNSSKPLVWDFQGDIASLITLNGSIAQSADLYHEVKIDVNGLPGSLQKLVGGISEPLKMNANWKGSIRENGLSGVLKLEKEGSFLADGTMDLQMSPEGILVNIDELLLSGLSKPLETIKILGGKLLFDGKQLKAQRVFVDVPGNQASVTGNWNIEERRGDFDCILTGAIKEKNIDYENKLSGNISWPENGARQIGLSVASHGNSPWGNWQSNADLIGSGETWFNSKWNINVPSLAWKSEKYNIRVDDIKTEIAANWPVIKFENIVSGNAHELNAQGEYFADTNNWKISFNADDLQIIENQNYLFDVKLTAQGDMQNITVNEFQVSYNDKILEGRGNMSLTTMELSGTHFKVSAQMNPKNQGKGMLENISGNLECETEITGTVWPMDLHCESVFTTDNIKVKNQAIESLKVQWEADIDSNGVTYNTEPINLFDGISSLDGRYDIKRHSAQVKLNTEQVSLRPVMQLFDLPIECKGIMQAALDVTLPLYNINQMVISGNWNVKDLVIPPIEAKDAEGRIVIEHGTAQFDKIRLLQGKGLAQGDAWFRLNQPEFVYVNVESQDWPVKFKSNNTAFVTDANGSATLNLSKRTIKGKGNITSDIAVGDKKLANVSAKINIEERLLDFNDMTIEALGGHAKGDISFQIDNWTNSNAYMDWEGIDLSELALYYPRLGNIEGKSSGSLIVQKAEDNRAFEPLQIEIRGTNGNVLFRNAKLGDFKISAYLGKDRLLIDKAQIDSLSGRIKSYGSVTKQVGNYSIYINTDFSDVEANQLLHAFLPNAKTVVGKLSGKGMLVIFSDLKRMTGEADIQLSESDLAQTKIIGTLYNAMKLKFADKKPSGYGQVKLRFEGSSLHIPSFEYFNRGTEIRGSGSIDDLSNGRKSPVRGYVFGSARPLKGINLLGIGELDKLMTSLQKNVTSVTVSGNLDNYDAQVVPFKEIRKSMRVLLWDQLHD